MSGKTTVDSNVSRLAPVREGRGRGLLQALLVLVIVAAGIAVAWLFVKFKKPPQHVEQDVTAPLVEVRTLTAGNVDMVIQGYGSVSPKVAVDLIPEVAGKVVFVHSELKAGGIIRANERILQIDPSDYELAVRQARAAVAEAEVGVDTEVAEADVAGREWRRLHPETEPDSPLVLREPQIRRARARLESAKAQLAVTELRLQRTAISLPFDVLLISERVDLGQFVGVGQSLATAYGVDAFEIEVPLEDEDLAWFDVFERSISLEAGGAERRHAPAEVTADFAGAARRWDGYVTRTVGQVDRTTRMVPVVVEVPNPLDLSGSKPPLLPGAFVKVLIAGRTLEDAIAVPRDAIHDGNRIWLVQDDRIHIQELDIIRVDGDFAYVTAGVPDGARLVVSALDTVVEGMVVRVRADAAQPSAQGESEGNIAEMAGGQAE